MLLFSLFVAWVIVLTAIPLAIEARQRGWRGTIVAKIWKEIPKPQNPLRELERKLGHWYSDCRERIIDFINEIESALIRRLANAFARVVNAAMRFFHD
jgi:hypothetical protein